MIDSELAGTFALKVDFKVLPVSFDMTQFNVSPLTCKDTDESWIFKLPPLINENKGNPTTLKLLGAE